MRPPACGISITFGLGSPAAAGSPLREFGHGLRGLIFSMVRLPSFSLRVQQGHTWISAQIARPRRRDSQTPASLNGRRPVRVARNLFHRQHLRIARSCVSARPSPSPVAPASASHPAEYTARWRFRCMAASSGASPCAAMFDPAPARDPGAPQRKDPAAARATARNRQSPEQEEGTPLGSRSVGCSASADCSCIAATERACQQRFRIRP